MKKTITIFALFFTIFTFSFSVLNAQEYFEDDFESGLSKWIVGGNNWDTLSTTYTSSNHCVTDSRIGNYTYNSDPAITMSQTINLSNSQNPVLSFFHKYSLRVCGGSPHDFIYIEISTNAGFNWTQVRYWQGSNVAWTHEQIDLSNYKTNIVKLRFRLSSHNSCGLNADGWYVDDVKIQEENTLNPTFSLPFSDNFENGLSKWYVGGFNWDTTSISPSSGEFCATDSKIGSYIYSSDPTLTMSGVLDLSNTVLPVLSFFHKYSLRVCGGSPHDNIFVEISTNGGYNWIQLQTFQGSSVAWSYAQYDLSNYKARRVKFRYHLSSHNSCGLSADGAYLDDVSIMDLSPSSINLQLTALIEGLYNPATNQMAREEKLKVSLREVFSPFEFVDSAIVGYIDPSGLSGEISFNNAPTGTYYIVVNNINGIETWSKTGGEFMFEDNSTYEYDFTTAASQAYGSNQTLKGSKYCIYSGDVNQSGTIDLTDVLQIRTAANLFTPGFTVTDLTGDDLTDLTDVLIAHNNSALFVTLKRP